MKPNSPDAARVWQRVLAPVPQEQQTLQLLFRQLRLDHEYLKRLAKSGEDRLPTLLVQEYLGQLQCLKGLLSLTGGRLPGNMPTKLPDHSLSRCFDHALQRLAASLNFELSQLHSDGVIANQAVGARSKDAILAML